MRQAGHNALAISVVICTQDRERELERCLRGLRSQSYSNFNVLVVDNAPQTAAAAGIARRWDAGYIVEPEAGLSRARNLGMHACSGEIVAFLDDDAVPDPEWLRSLAAEFTDPQVMAVAGRIQELECARGSAEAVRDLFSLDCVGDQRRVVDRGDPEWFEMANFGGIGQGSNMAIRRSALQWWPGFDHRLGRGTRISGSEEHYAFFRLIDRGYRAVYAPEAIVFHPYPADLQALRQRELRHLAASTGYMAFLFFEVPDHRRKLVRYVMEAMRGVRRTWRIGSPGAAGSIVSAWRGRAAMLTGPLYISEAGSTAGGGQGHRPTPD